MTVIARPILLVVLLAALPCRSAFVSVGARSSATMKRPPIAAAILPRHDRVHDSCKHAPLNVRGGGSESSARLSAVVDYSEAARSLFGSFVTPASIIITALVPMSLQHISVPRHGESPFRSKLRGLYYVICLLATCSQIISVISATMASSYLLGANAVPAKSTFDLVIQNCELPWIVTVVHFIGGLLGFIAAGGIGAYLSFPEKFQTAGASFAAATVLWLIRMIDVRAAAFQRYGLGSCCSILTRYFTLTSKQLLQWSSLNALGLTSVALASLAIILTARALISPED